MKFNVIARMEYARRLHRQGRRVRLALDTTEWHYRVCDSSYAFASRASADIAYRHMRQLAALLGLHLAWTPYREATAPGYYTVQTFFHRPDRLGGLNMSGGRRMKDARTRKLVEVL